MKEMICELCNGEASLFCVSDSAFLCRNCDSKVHGANFLVARHVRRTICCKCQEFDGNRICGSNFRARKQICRSCSPESDDHQTSDAESSCTSTCISSSKELKYDQERPAKIVCLSSFSDISGEFSSLPTTKTSKTKIVDVKAEDILVNWCRKLGVKRNNSTITLALHAFSISLSSLTTLPFRVLVASSLWMSLKLNEEMASTRRYLKKVEELSGVPGKLIIVVEKKITRALKIDRKTKVDLKEGWAECSN